MSRNVYPGYNVLDKWHSPSWNEVSRRAIATRLTSVPPRRFFTEHEWRTLEAVCNRLLPQPDRPGNPIPIVPWIDEKLFNHKGEGYRYEGMPPMETTWRSGLKGIDEDSQEQFHRRFMELNKYEQIQVLKCIQDGKVKGPSWKNIAVKLFFSSTLLKTAVAVYYAHPSAWNEIGFGGPASPRGYVRLEANTTDPWEAQEQKGPEIQE